MTISIRIPEEEKKLVQEFAKAHKISVSQLIRESVLEKIEDEIDLAIAEKAVKEHEEKDESISFDEFLNVLGYDL